MLIFIEKTDRKNMSAVSKALILDFFIELQKTWSPGSFRTAASAIKSFLVFSEHTELLAVVPEKLPKKRTIIPVLTQDEGLAVWSAINSDAVCSRDKAVVLILLLTGMRAIDIINLKLRDIDWNCDIISITQKKTGKTLTLPLLPVIGNAIATYIATDRPKTNLPYVFLSRVSPHGAIADHAGCYSVTKNIFQIAGIRIGSDKVKGTRLFRHSIASKMLENGVAIQTISSVLGHSNPSTTDIYITIHEEKMRQCALPVSVIPMNVRGLN